MTVRADAQLLPFASRSCQIAVTSPPYFGKVQYGDGDAEHGLGTLGEYIDEIGHMAAEVWRVLDDRGTFWLNIGDTMANSGGAGGDYNAHGRKHWKRKVKQGSTGISGSQHALVPQRVAIALQDQGWLVRRWIVWSKAPYVRPENPNHVRRPLDQHETILLLAKHRDYRYRPGAHKMFNIPYGDVWNFPQERNRTGHFAPFPEELPRRAILLSSVAGDRVLDPYVGSGTTARVAESLNRVAVGADLYEGVDD